MYNIVIMAGKNNDISDSDIVSLVLSGDINVYSLIVERYEAKLMRYAMFILKDYDVASDITQETFIKAYENLRGFKLDKHFSPWIYRILHNGAMNYIKKSKMTSPLSAVSEIDDGFLIDFRHDKTLDKKVLDKNVRECLDKIDIKYREVLMLNFFENLKYDEISDILHVPISTVGVRIRRGKISLKKLCQEKGIQYE